MSSAAKSPMITVSAGLLDPRHVKAIGPAVWTHLARRRQRVSSHDPDDAVRHRRAPSSRSGELPRGKVGVVSAEGPPGCRNTLTGPDLKAGPAKNGGSNVKAVRRTLLRGRGSAILSVPGWPKRKSWLGLYENDGSKAAR